MKQRGGLFVVVVAVVMVIGCSEGLTPVEPVEPVEPVAPVEPVEPTGPKQLCMNGAAAAENPLLCERGKIAMNGIDRIPLDMVKLTNEQMRQMYVDVDTLTVHADDMGFAIDWSYVTRTMGDDDIIRYYFGHDASNRNRITRNEDGTVTTITTAGSIPVMEFVDLCASETCYDYDRPWWPHRQTRALGGTVKLASYPFVAAEWLLVDFDPNAIPVDDSLSTLDDGDMSYLVIHGTGNDGIISSWFEHVYTQKGKDQINRAIAGNNILFVSTWEYENGRYVRRYSSDLCVDVDEACLWVRGTQPQLGTGVSSAVAHLSASIASVLAVFPDTEYQDLSKFTKACAKKRGEGIEELLREFGGLGVADFGCMDKIIEAARALPAGGTTTVDIDGKTVRVSERMLVVE